jgi:transposase
VNLREEVNGLMYILSTGCPWRAIPKDLPPRSTLYDYFDLWSWDGTLDSIHHTRHGDDCGKACPNLSIVRIVAVSLVLNNVAVA